MTNLDVQRELVARSCRILGKLNLTKETSGHVSARVAGTDRLLIRARGPGESGMRFTEARDIVTVGLDGHKVYGTDALLPPQEVFLHTWIYRTLPKINSVVHVHPATVVLLTICDQPLLPVYGGYDPRSLRLLMDGIPTYQRSVLIASDALGHEFVTAMGKKKACLMRGHGITTAGASVEEATIIAIKVNELAEMNYRAQLLGRARPISDADLDAFRAFAAREEPMGDGSASEPAREDVRVRALWRYYWRLVDDEPHRVEGPMS